ncbi:MAG: DUF924 domain-containing protein [Moraxellaceae bacterium]|nr:MAG: DUF924 domain-containing protein [Moraxellaceae bacterium]
MTSQQVLNFWFEQTTPAQWFEKDARFDQQIQQQFGKLHTRVAAAELSEWRSSSEGRLAEIIVLDQFSRNLYRDQAAGFACDGMALVLAQEAIAQGADQQLSTVQCSFLYMPFMHSESRVIHKTALDLFTRLGNENNLKFEKLHKAIIDRFGRYPHRNAVLGRTSTPEELEFLQQPNSSF